MNAFDPVFDRPAHIAQGKPVVVNRPQQFADPNGKWARLTLEERITQIKAMDADGLTKREIADELETTRSAIAAFAHHNHVRLVTSALKTMAAGPPLIPAEPPDPAAFIALPGSTPTTILALDANQCRWPVVVDGIDLFCACKTKRGPYCDAHATLNKKRRA
jgi:hypothetical protein